MKVFKGLINAMLILISIISLVLLFGVGSIIYTKTIGKEQQNVKREVFEETNSFTKAKRQEILKAYGEWMQADSIGKKGIENILKHSLSDFNEDKFISDLELKKWVKKIKYNKLE